MKRRRLWLLILVFPLLAGMAPAPRQEVPAITLAVEAGYAGFYRQGQWVPVRITATNDGESLEGVVRARPDNGGSLEETIYQMPLSLPRGSRKQVFLYVSLEVYMQPFQVEIVTQQGQIAARQTVTLRGISAGDLLYAVISESVYGAADLAARPPGTAKAQQVLWRSADIPAFAEALMGLDVVLFHDVDTGALRPEQVEALRQWVLAGGHLIVAGGNPWQRTTARLAELLPVTLQGTVQLDSAAAFGAYLRQPAQALHHPITAVLATPLPGARVLIAQGDVPLVVRQRYGTGWVDFLAVEPQEEPLRSWSGMGDVWQTLIVSTGQNPSWARGFAAWATARDGTLTSSYAVLPPTSQLCGFLIVYILLIGPVNYLVLKRVGRREWAWFTIPALIVLFSGLAYTVGFNLRGTEPVVNRLTVIRAWVGHERAQVHSLLGVQSPRRRYYDIAVEPGYALRTLPQQGIGINVPVVLNQGARHSAEDILIDGGTIASLVASGTQAAPQVVGSATWQLGTAQPPHLTGTITNASGLILEDAVLVIKGEARSLGTLEPGQTVPFDIVIGSQGPAPLLAGTDVAGSFGSTGWMRRGNVAWCFSYEGLALTVPDVMQGESFACSATGISDRQREIRRRYRLLSALVVDHDESGGRGDGAYLFAWAAHPTVGVDLPGYTYRTEDTVLYLFEMPVTAIGLDRQVAIPPALTGWVVAGLDDARVRRDVAPDKGFQVTDQDFAVFEFMPLPLMRLARVDQLTLEYLGLGNVVTELWDWQAQAWEVVPRDPTSHVTVVGRAARFAGPENAVRVRLSGTNPLPYNRVDYVQIGYRGVLARSAGE